VGIGDQPAGLDGVGDLQPLPFGQSFIRFQAVGLGQDEPEAGIAVDRRRDGLQGVALADGIGVKFLVKD
jgi:hypothetical protein